MKSSLNHILIIIPLWFMTPIYADYHNQYINQCVNNHPVSAHGELVCKKLKTLATASRKPSRKTGNIVKSKPSLAVSGASTGLFGRNVFGGSRRGSPERVQERSGSGPGASKQAQSAIEKRTHAKKREKQLKSTAFLENAKLNEP